MGLTWASHNKVSTDFLDMKNVESNVVPSPVQVRDPLQLTSKLKAQSFMKPNAHLIMGKDLRLDEREASFLGGSDQVLEHHPT